MSIRDFQMGWRLLLKSPGHSLIMVLSLTAGFAVWFLALGFTRYELAFDKHVPGLAEVYVVKARPNWGDASWSENVPLAMKDSLQRSGFPLQVTMVLPFSVAATVGNVVRTVELTVVDPDFAQVFHMSALEGVLVSALARPDAVVLTQETALTLFGDVHAVGQRLDIGGQPFQVGAVVANPPKTSSVQIQALVGAGSAAWGPTERARAQDSWNAFDGDHKEIVLNKVYLRLPDAGRRADVLAVIERDIDSSAMRGHLGPGEIIELGSKPPVTVALGRLADSYMDSEARNNSGPKGDPIANLALNGVALLILLLTAGNYINLANIRVVQREREMAVRKALGARPAQLATQLVVESVLVSLIAAVLGSLLAFLLLPFWSDLTEHDIGGLLGGADYAAFALIVLIAGVVVGIGAGAYPAWTALKMRITPVLGGRGGSDTPGGLRLRRVLTVLQFSIAMFVTAMIVAIAWQIRFLKAIDYGYPVDGLIVAKLPSGLGKAEVDSFAAALQKLPEVRSVARSSASNANRPFATSTGESLMLGTRLVGPTYFSTLGLIAQAGRVFDGQQDAGESQDVVVLNRQAAVRLGYAEPSAAVGQFIRMESRTVQVVGIAQDVRNGFTAGQPRPLVYALSDAAPDLTIRTNAGFDATQTAVTKVWQAHFPARYLGLRELRAQLESNAGGPMAVLLTCVVVAVVIVPLAVFSIYVLSAVVVQRRAREFVMRKLYGAKQGDIARLLLREFGILQGVAAVISLPLAYFVGRSFVERFADQAAIGLWAVLAALAGALLIAGIATFRHIFAASRLAPAAVLRAS
jgi:putative ABC transport system permease protein